MTNGPKGEGKEHTILCGVRIFLHPLHQGLWQKRMHFTVSCTLIRVRPFDGRCCVSELL